MLHTYLLTLKFRLTLLVSGAKSSHCRVLTDYSINLIKTFILLDINYYNTKKNILTF